MFRKSAKEKAAALHDEGMALDAAGQEDLALNKYFAALELDPARPQTLYNIGLIYKYRHQWPESFRYNKRAVELAPDDEATNWNLAIAATALRDWASARTVWHRLGLPIEESDAPIEGDFGVGPVRLNPDSEGEVVWGVRIDPVRMRILSIPFPGSGFRHRDVVLHDGAAVGYRLYQGVERPVFNVLELFEPSAYATYEAEIFVSRQEDLDALEAACEAAGVAFEDWTRSVRTLCKQCSEGIPHEHHDHDEEARWPARHDVALAALDEAVVRQVIEGWQNAERRVERFELALEP